uniref:DNA-directed RNA polymerase subunit B n=1 Tax=Spironucleus salmonicida TaxID=348837 RepID=V6LMA7_9EUKA|eukprot:EST44841.1 DNA-directed RNA polymerase subunit B [Spironucleus salmonicida]
MNQLLNTQVNEPHIKIIMIRASCDWLKIQSYQQAIKRSVLFVRKIEIHAVINYGKTALLRGRLCTESDGRIVEICEDCGGIWIQGGKCQVCQGALKKCIMPKVCLVLVSELSGMGVKMSFKVE